MLKELTSNEIVVAGVYLRLFVANPAWTLRKPKQFLSDLLDLVVESISKAHQVDEATIELSCSALVELLRSQPYLADEIPVLGHLPKLFHLLNVQPKNTLAILHQISLSEVRWGFLPFIFLFYPFPRSPHSFKTPSFTAYFTQFLTLFSGPSEIFGLWMTFYDSLQALKKVFFFFEEVKRFFRDSQ